MKLKFIKYKNKLRSFVVTAALFVVPLAGSISVVTAQQVVPPMDIPLYLAGNFGELRTNHFHSGIDFKTQGRIGIPVMAVKEGFISRISVSPWGYGRALYVDHPDGTTTVYGHLDHFNKAIESFTVDSQYIKQSFKVDLLISSEQFPVKQGEVIGYSGNTGGSSGPHLHFELRETASQNTHDPLVLYQKRIKDTTRPRIQSLIAYPQKGEGVVNGRTNKQHLSIKNDKKSGKPSLSPDINVWGKVGFSVKAYDYMNDTHNAYGVKEITLKIDNKTVYYSNMSCFSFDETRYLNTFVDWEEWTFKKSFYIKSFIEPGNKFPSYQMNGTGIFDFKEERTYKIAYILRDLYGNSETFDFTVQGEKQTIPTTHPAGILFPCNSDNIFERNGISLLIPTGNLYTDVDFIYGSTNDYTPFSPLYKLGERTPLHSYCPLSITIQKDIFPQKERYGIISLSDGKQQWIGGDYSDGKICAKIRELGSFSVTIDTVPPVVTPLNPNVWSKNKKISFKLTDNLSGISSWIATVDEKFVLFELDGKNSYLFCPFSARNMHPGKRTLKLTVRDACGNESVYEEIINI